MRERKVGHFYPALLEGVFMFELSLTSWKLDVPEVVKENDPTTGKEANVFSGKTIQDLRVAADDRSR